MAKKKQQDLAATAGGLPATAADATDLVMRQEMEDSKERWGGRAFVDGDDAIGVFCMEVPLALKLLLQLSGLPIGRLYMVVGPPESCKSALAYELGRLHRVLGGGYNLIETEEKHSPDLRKSISGYDDRRVYVTPVTTLEDLMRALRYQSEIVKRYMEEHYKPPRSVPWAFLADSVAGVTTENIAKKIDEAGAAPLVQPVAANQLSTFMKRLVHWLDPFPISIIGVNHLKLAPDDYGQLTVRKIQGGYAPRFHESIEFELVSLGRQQEVRAGFAYRFRTLLVRVAKNSLAQHGPALKVNMMWWNEPANPAFPDGPQIQRTVWDWQSTIVKFLLEPDIDQASKKRLKTVLDLQSSKKEKMVWSAALGIPETAPVSYRQAGLLLDQRPDLQQQLFPLLGIRQCFMFTPGRDIVEQKEEARARILRIPGDLCDYRLLTQSPQAMEPAL